MTNIIDKFINDVKSYKNSLESQLSAFEQDFKLLNIVKEYLNSGDYEVLFNLLNLEYELDDTLSNTIRALKYFHDNNKINLPQFKDLLDRISNCELFKSLSNNKDDIEEKLNDAKEKIILCEDIINENNYDSSLILTIFNEYDYTREDILEVLTIISKKTCPVREIEIVEENEHEIVVDNELTSKKKVVLESSKDLFEKIDSLVTDNYALIKKYNSDPKLSGYLNLALDVLEEAQKDISELDYEEISFVMLINKLLENKKAYVDMVFDATGDEDLEYLKTEPENLRKQYEAVLEKAPKIMDDEEPLNAPMKKVIYLTDDNNNLFFNPNELTQNASFIDKLSRGLFDYKKGKKPPYIKGIHNDNYLVRTNLKGSDSCSFIELPNNIVLLITIDSYDNLFQNTIQIVNKYDKKIETLREMAAKDPETLIYMNNELIKSILGEGRK